MTDINDKTRPKTMKVQDASIARGEDENAHSPGDPALLDLAELLFFAYRDFTREPDKILYEIGFGRAHHRVLHFVNRHPGMRVANLLEILQITKQSLGRVLKQLVDDGFILQKAGKTDRRERLLYPTPRGKDLAERLAAPQLRRIARALETSGTDANACVEEFLRQMISDTDASPIAQLLKNSARRVRDEGDAGDEGSVE